MRRLFACLLACALAGAAVSGCTGPAASPSEDMSEVAGATSIVQAAPTPSPMASPAAIGSPSTGPAVSTAWTTRAVAVRSLASDQGQVQVYLGPDFPVAMTTKSTTISDRLWCEASWQTPGRHGLGWLPADALTMFKPQAMPQAGIDALDEDLGAYVAGLGERVGVQVLDVTGGVRYAYNGNRQYVAGNAMAVPIMLTFLSQLETQKREPTAAESALLASMVEDSSVPAARALYAQVGAQRGINAYMKELGVTGLSPAPVAAGLGYSAGSMKPATMVALLSRLHEGTILTQAHRAIARKLMESVSGGQRIGVGDSSPAGATVAMKAAWAQVYDGSRTHLVNSSGIVTVGGETYVISVFTDGNPSLAAGYAIVRHVCEIVGERLVPVQAG
jgi:hypothetical protein